jgi:glycosyltransferase involved in cell wall biosynthesis
MTIGRNVDIIVPCYNEGEMLPIFFDRITEIVSEIKGYDFTFIFVDDGSSDDTLSIIEDFAKKDSRVKYISFSRNFGKEAALYAGYNNSDGDLVVAIDADLQHPPELIEPMIKGIVEEGYDSCSARRVSRKGEPKIRSAFARAFYKLINKISDIDLVDGAVDYRMMTRQMKDAILSMGEKERFTKGIFSWVGFTTKWIEFKNVERLKGETKWSFFGLFKYAINGITAFTTAPLKIATYGGVIISIISFISLIVEVIKTLIVGIQKTGYPTIVSLMLLIFGIMLLFFGIIGEYLAKMYIEIKSRPIYITRKTNIRNGK